MKTKDIIKGIIITIILTAILSFILLNLKLIFYSLIVLLLISIVMRYVIKESNKVLWGSLAISTFVISVIVFAMQYVLLFTMYQSSCDVYGPGYKAAYNKGEYSRQCPVVCKHPQNGVYCINTKEKLEEYK